NDRKVCQTPVDGDELYDVTALADHTLNYYETETATTSLSDVPVVNSAVPGVYTIYVSQVSTDTGCEGPRAAVTIEVVETVPPALTELEQTFCEIEMATVGDLNTAGATGTVNWYAADGTTLTGTELLVSGAYYAAQVVDGCESVSRTEVEVTITIIPAPTLTNLDQI